MPDTTNPPEGSAPDPDAGDWSRSEIEAAIAGLDRATRNFSQRVEALNRETGQPVGSPSEALARFAAQPEPEPEPRPQPRQRQPGQSAEARHRSLEEEMSDAEREAREYLNRAKKRADSLVTTMIGAVEREAAEIRRDAEQGIRERWRVVEAEAGRYLEDARTVADGIVAERQEEIGELSDNIVTRAETLTDGLEDAERIKRQFEDFVRALSQTSNRIADEAAGRTESEITRLRSRHGALRRGALAA